MKQLKRLKNQTNEDYANAISEDFVNQIIKSNKILIDAIDNDDFETAIRIRDYLSACVESITLQVSLVMGFEEAVLRKHYQEQNKLVYDSMIKEKERVNNK